MTDFCSLIDLRGRPEPSQLQLCPNTSQSECQSTKAFFIIVPQGIGLAPQLPAWWRTACSSSSSRPKSSRSDSRYTATQLCLLQVPHLYNSLSKVLYSVALPQESRKRVKLEKKELPLESQLFIMELARELNRICQVSLSPPLFVFSLSHKITGSHLYLSLSQRSNILSHIWTSEDIWQPSVCRDFIVEWAAVLEKRGQVQTTRVF